MRQAPTHSCGPCESQKAGCAELQLIVKSEKWRANQKTTKTIHSARSSFVVFWLALHFSLFTLSCSSAQPAFCDSQGPGGVWVLDARRPFALLTFWSRIYVSAGVLCGRGEQATPCMLVSLCIFSSHVYCSLYYCTVSSPVVVCALECCYSGQPSLSAWGILVCFRSTRQNVCVCVCFCHSFSMHTDTNGSLCL